MCRSLTLTLGSLVAAVSIITSPQVVGDRSKDSPFPCPRRRHREHTTWGRQHVLDVTLARRRRNPSPRWHTPSNPSPIAQSFALTPRLAFRSGPYSYLVERRDSGSSLTVTKDALSEPILWAFGQGQAGQTYVIKHEGSYY